MIFGGEICIRFRGLVFGSSLWDCARLDLSVDVTEVPCIIVISARCSPTLVLGFYGSLVSSVDRNLARASDTSGIDSLKLAGMALKSNGFFFSKFFFSNKFCSAFYWLETVASLTEVPLTSSLRVLGVMESIFN